MNIARRILGGCGGLMQLFATALPFFAKGNIDHPGPTLSLVAVNPWLGAGSVALGLLAIGLAAAGANGWFWLPLGLGFAAFACLLGLLKPAEHAISVGAWSYVTGLVLLTLAFALRGRTRPAA